MPAKKTTANPQLKAARGNIAAQLQAFNNSRAMAMGSTKMGNVRGNVAMSRKSPHSRRAGGK